MLSVYDMVWASRNTALSASGTVRILLDTGWSADNRSLSALGTGPSCRGRALGTHGRALSDADTR
jgi:hypothetical protein